MNVYTRLTISIIRAFISASEMRETWVQGISPNGDTTLTSLKSPERLSGVVPACKSSRRLLRTHRSEEHTSELQSLMRISYAVFCLKKKKEHEHVTKEKQHRQIANKKKHIPYT